MVKKREKTLADTFATPIEVTIKGKQFMLSPITLGDFAALEQHVKSANVNTFVDVAKSALLTGKEVAEGIREILDSQGSSAPFQASSSDGTLFLLWRAINKNHSDLTLDDVGNLVGIEDMHIIQTLMSGAQEDKEESSSDPKNASDGEQ